VGVLIHVRDDIPRSWRWEKFAETGMSELAKPGISPLEQPSTVVAATTMPGGLPDRGASGAIVTAMAARQVTCGSCGARTNTADQDWPAQRDVIDEWWDEHVRSSHPDQDSTEIVQHVEPNPLFEPAPVNPFWR
jgi:hypothetical protein